MIYCGMCGSLPWVLGIVIRAHCWDCLKGQQKHTVPAPDTISQELHPLSYQVLIWDRRDPHHFVVLMGNYPDSWLFILVNIIGVLLLSRNLNSLIF
jgi:hypothetical protein